MPSDTDAPIPSPDPLEEDVVEMSELEFAVASAIELAESDLMLPLTLPPGSHPDRWLPEARCAIATVVQVIRDQAAIAGPAHRSAWLDLADWLEEQLLPGAARQPIDYFLLPDDDDDDFDAASDDS